MLGLGLLLVLRMGAQPPRRVLLVEDSTENF